MTFPDPTSQHLEVLAGSLLRMVLAERGLDPRWVVPFDDAEHAALHRYWRGGSLRRLGRLVEGVLAARDQRCRGH